PAGAFARLGSTRLRQGSMVTGVAFSPDGSKLASGGWDWSARLWDPATGRQTRLVDTRKGWVWAVAFSPDGRTLATAQDHRGRGVALWDVATGELTRECRGHSASVYAVAFSSDGKTLASGGQGGIVHLWDAATGAAQGRLQCRANVRAVAFAPGDKVLATA